LRQTVLDPRQREQQFETAEGKMIEFVKARASTLEMRRAWLFKRGHLVFDEIDAA
jgi:hypothetical protein